MMNRILVEILLSLFALLIVSQRANGLATNKCTDVRLKDEIKKQARCLVPLANKYVTKLLKVYEKQKFNATKIFDLAWACRTHKKLLKRVKKCNIEFATNCLDSEMVEQIRLG